MIYHYPFITFIPQAAKMTGLKALPFAMLNRILQAKKHAWPAAGLSVQRRICL
jgi:hypothetical protein